MKALYWQNISARDKAFQRLLSWPLLSFTPVIKIPIHDPNAISIIGVGEYFDPVFADDMMCICVAPCLEPQPGGDLIQLVNYLKNGGGK